MTNTMYSVTLTGKVQAGKDAPAVWRRVEHLLKLDAQTFRQRVLARVPITLQAADDEVAKRQHLAVLACGADAELRAEDDAPRLWLHMDGATHGPVSHAYAKSAMARGELDPDLRACELGEQDWVALRELFAASAAPEPEAGPERQPRSDRVAGTLHATEPAATARSASSTRHLPGWGIAGLVILAAVAIMAVFIVLFVRAVSG